jgi:hypothetical protein
MPEDHTSCPVDGFVPVCGGYGPFPRLGMPRGMDRTARPVSYSGFDTSCRRTRHESIQQQRQQSHALRCCHEHGASGRLPGSCRLPRGLQQPRTCRSKGESNRRQRRIPPLDAIPLSQPDPAKRRLVFHGQRRRTVSGRRLDVVRCLFPCRSVQGRSPTTDCRSAPSRRSERVSRC